MESNKQSSHPSLVAINDEILSAQLRLMELYVKQAHATAASEAARLQERFEAQLTELQKKLEQKEFALEAHQVLSLQADQNLRAELKELQAQLFTSQRLSEERKADLDASRFEAGVLRERISQLEATVQSVQINTVIEINRAQEALQMELVALKGQLEQKEAALQVLQTAVQEVEEQLRSQIRDLDGQLAATAELLGNRTIELQSAQSEISALREHIQQLDFSKAQTEAAVSDATRIREDLQAELIALRTALEQKEVSLQQKHAEVRELENRLHAELGSLQGQLIEKQGLLERRSQEIGELTAKISDLQEQITCLELANKQTLKEAKTAARALEDSFNARIREAEAVVAEKTRGLQDRTAELENAQAEAALLRERIGQLELANRQTEAVANEATRIQDSLQTELVAIRTAFEQKDLSLQENQVAAKALEECLTGQLEDLQRELSEKQALLEARNQEVGELAAKTNDLQRQITCLELVNKQTAEGAEAAARALEDNLRARIQELEAAVSEKAQDLDARRLELERAQSEAAVLHRRIEEVERIQARIEAAKSEADRMREGLEHELAVKQERLEAQDGKLSEAAAQIATRERRIAELESLWIEARAAAAAGAERVRQEFQETVAALQTSLREKDQELQQRRKAAAETEANLNAEIQEVRDQLARKQELLDGRAEECQKLLAEAAAFRQHIAQLEFAASEAKNCAVAEAERLRAERREELAVLQAQLVQRDLELAKSRSSMQDSEKRLQAQLHDCQIQITEKQLLLEARALEIAGLQGKLTALSEESAELKARHQSAETDAAEAGIARQRLEAELAARQEELRHLSELLTDRESQCQGLQQTAAAELEALRAELAEKQELLDRRSREMGEFATRASDLQEQITCLELANKQTVKEAKAAARSLEDSLRARIQELEAAVSEKAQDLDVQRLELERAQSEAAVLHQRIEELEQTRAQIEAARSEADQMREGLGLELQAVQQALAQKDDVLAQREAAFRESTDHLQARLTDLQNQLAEARAARESQKREFYNAASEITALQNRIQELESAKAAALTEASAGIDRLREDHQLELESLRTELAKQQATLEESQTALHALEIRLRAEIHRLETELADKQALLDRNHVQVQERESEISALREEIARSEFARKQTETLAAAQAEQIREQVKAEVGVLEARLKEKENALGLATDRARALESVLNEKIADLQTELADKQSLMENRDRELPQLQTRISNLLEQIDDLKRAHEQELERQRTATLRLEQDLGLQLTEVQTELAAKLALLESRKDAVEALESKISGLIERLGQTEAKLKESEAAAHQFEQNYRQSETERAAQQQEILRQVDRLQRQEAAWRSAEEHLQLEVNNLRAEVAEKHGLLENRNDELVRAKTELDAFQERIAYLESAISEAEEEARQKADHEGEQARLELDKLWNELNQKEQALVARPTAVNDVGQNLPAQISVSRNDSRNELAEKQALLENPGTGFLLGEPKLTESQKEKLSRLEQLVETIKADNEQNLMASHHRKWRFSLGRKRRWKS